jgi:hypothetical protein
MSILRAVSWEEGHSGGGMNLTTRLHLLPMSRPVELHLYSPLCLHAWYFIKHEDNFNLWWKKKGMKV